MGKLDESYTVVGLSSGVACPVAWPVQWRGLPCPQQFGLVTGHGHSTPRNAPKRNENKHPPATRTQMFTAALLTTAKKWARPTRPSVGGGTAHRDNGTPLDGEGPSARSSHSVSLRPSRSTEDIGHKRQPVWLCSSGTFQGARAHARNTCAVAGGFGVSGEVLGHRVSIRGDKCSQVVAS